MEAGGAHGEKDQIDRTGVGNALRASRRDHDDIARPHVLGRKAIDFNAAVALNNHVSFSSSTQQVSVGGHAGFNPGAGD